jgi:sarcosine oxidase subunit beta
VVNAAGAWAGAVAAMAGERLPIEAQAPTASVTAPLPRFLSPVVQTLTRRLTLKQMPDGRAWTGGVHRAALGPDGYTPDRACIVGRLTEGGPVHACGFSGQGFQTAPAVGVIIAHLLGARPVPVDVRALGPDRFGPG